MSLRLSVFSSSLFFLLFLSFSFRVWALGEVEVKAVSYQENKAGHYLVQCEIANTTDEAREVILRAAIHIYEKASPKGDLPLMVLRKDSTIVLRPQETRALQIPILNEGDYPRGSFRTEATVRIHRQRPWSY